MDIKVNFALTTPNSTKRVGFTVTEASPYACCLLLPSTANQSTIGHGGRAAKTFSEAPLYTAKLGLTTDGWLAPTTMTVELRDGRKRTVRERGRSSRVTKIWNGGDKRKRGHI
uniref:PLAT domain-containing protein n=1 Tax=Steinernema glaseri TaxID=37863 RepID=A0A1I7Y189_9BILA